MGYLRTMGAGLAGSTTKLYGNANVNQIQYGDKLQGLPPVTGRRDPYRVYKSKAGGNAPGRFRVFCMNQLGGIGMGNKNSQFAPNADGLGWCPNRKNSREGDIGINKADRRHKSNRSQSRADEKAEFEILTHIRHHSPHHASSSTQQNLLGEFSEMGVSSDLEPNTALVADQTEETATTCDTTNIKVSNFNSLRVPGKCYTKLDGSDNKKGDISRLIKIQPDGLRWSEACKDGEGQRLNPSQVLQCGSEEAGDWFFESDDFGGEKWVCNPCIYGCGPKD